MFRFLLLVLILGGVALFFTNPDEAAVRAKLDQQAAGLTGADKSGLPPAVTDMLTQKAQGKLTLTRENYYLFSVYKTSVGNTALPGCLIGVAGQAVPYDQC